jgi:hypothetical protein
MEEKNEFELIVSQGKRPIWSTIVAALFFTYMIYSIYMLIQMLWKFGFLEGVAQELPRFAQNIGYTLAGGISFSVTKTVLIDIDKSKLISRYFVGPFSKDVLSVVPDLEYISVFLDSKGYYQVNLWYKGNKHYKMYDFEEKNPALEFAQQAAAKLNIDLLDATEKGNSKWMEIS